MKRIFIIALCITALTFFIIYKKNTEDKVSENTIYIGIAKIITHPALDLIEQGIKDELAEQGFDNIKYDVQSANGEMSTASSIAHKFKAEKVDIAVGIATPSALAIANQIKDRPVIFSGVSDPVSAGLRKGNEPEAGNIVGVSDMAPVRQQIELIVKMLPKKEHIKIGHIYTPSEANSVAMMEIAKEVCAEMGIELLISSVTKTAEVKAAAEVIAPKVDAIYISNDNTVVAALTGVTESAYKYNVPVFSADPTSAMSSNVTIAYGIDNYQTGRATGKMISDLLRGKTPNELSVKQMTEPYEMAKFINEPLVKKMNLTIAEELK